MTSPSMQRWLSWCARTAVCIVLAMPVLAGLGCAKGAKATPGRPQEMAVPVTVADVVSKAVPLEVRTFGTVETVSTVAVKSQTGGILTVVHLKEGQDVKGGDLLFTIDPRPSDAALKQAEANRAKDAVQQENAAKESLRQQELFGKRLASEEAYDQARASADALTAVLRADDAAIENAKLQLEYCSIRSPIDGRTGSLLVDQGNLVKANDAALVTINQIKPIHVGFSLPQRELPRIMKEMAAAAQSAAGKLKVQAFIPGEEEKPEIGEVTFTDNAVDRTTGTIKLWGTFANDGGRLWPGQFVNVTLTLSVQPNAIAVPSKAVLNGQDGTYAFIVLPDNTVEDRMVTVERTVGDLSIIAKGLQAGERVVTDGQLRLKPKAKVRIVTAASAHGAANGAAQR